MDEVWRQIEAFFTFERVLSLVKVLVILIVGWYAARLLAAGARRVAHVRSSEQGARMIARLVRYGVFTIALMMALSELGFDLGILLGAAGVLTVALGFASQTSASNVISGLFLMGERPFTIGDFIRINQTEGTVLSIDLLSVKLRTLNNLFVRVPNTTMLTSEVVNFSRYPTRRIDLPVGVAYDEDLGRVRKLLLDLAWSHPLIFDEPKATVTFIGFGESSMNLELRFWTRRENVIEMRSMLPEAIKAVFDEAGVEIPFPQRVLHIARDEADALALSPPADTTEAAPTSSATDPADTPPSAR